MSAGPNGRATEPLTYRSRIVVMLDLHTSEIGCVVCPTKDQALAVIMGAETAAPICGSQTFASLILPEMADVLKTYPGDQAGIWDLVRESIDSYRREHAEIVEGVS